MTIEVSDGREDTVLKKYTGRDTNSLNTSLRYTLKDKGMNHLLTVTLWEEGDSNAERGGGISTQIDRRIYHRT